MKKKKYTYEELVDVLKNTPPVLDDREMLTEAILSHIQKSPRKNYKLLLRMGRISGIAATLLIAVFISETFFFIPSDRAKIDNVVVSDISPVTFQRSKAIISENEFMSEMNLSEKTQVFREFIEEHKSIQTRFNRIVLQTKLNLKLQTNENK